MFEASPACHPVGILSTTKAYENMALSLGSTGHWQKSNCTSTKKLSTNNAPATAEYLEEMNLGGLN